VLTLVLPAGAAAAGGEASFSLQPSPARTPAYFIFNAQPGAKLTGTLLLANVGGASGTASLYSVDATTGANGGASYLSKTSPRRGVGRWLHLTFSQATLDPHKQALIPFTLDVPEDATPGQHLGGLVADDTAGKTDETGAKAGFQIRVQHLSIVAVEVIIAGPSKLGVRLMGVRASKRGKRQTILLGLRNTGTVMVKPTGSLLIYASHHRLVQQAQFAIDTFLPQTAIEYPVFARSRPLAAGTYTASVTLHYGNKGVTRRQATFTVAAN
jgi:hypothetical protein